eukprot:ctg_356.g196
MQRGAFAAVGAIDHVRAPLAGQTEGVRGFGHPDVHTAALGVERLHPLLLLPAVVLDPFHGAVGAVPLAEAAAHAVLVVDDLALDVAVVVVVDWGSSVCGRGTAGRGRSGRPPDTRRWGQSASPPPVVHRKRRAPWRGRRWHGADAQTSDNSSSYRCRDSAARSAGSRRPRPPPSRPDRSDSRRATAAWCMSGYTRLPDATPPPTMRVDRACADRRQARRACRRGSEEWTWWGATWSSRP